MQSEWSLAAPRGAYFARQIPRLLWYVGPRLRDEPPGLRYTRLARAFVSKVMVFDKPMAEFERLNASVAQSARCYAVERRPDESEGCSSDHDKPKSDRR
jgi:hypothetical protein